MDSTESKGLPVGADHFQAASDGISRLKRNIQSVITIKEERLEYILAARIAGGHVILADTHGVGKTSLARALAGSFQWHDTGVVSDGVAIEQFNRIQCTVDLLPQDILGFNRFDMARNEYIFNRGPIFAHFILCDEINLLTPKTQGSFFQVMEEQTVSIEGDTFRLPDPFFIIATMNLKGAHLFPLPAPQLDRFMLQISIGYPEHESELDIVERHGREDSWGDFGPVIDSRELLAWQKLVDEVTISREVLDYIVRFVRKTREYPGVVTGASPRAGIKVSRLARALALARGLSYVSIDLVKELLIPACAHRLELEDPMQGASEIIGRIVREIKV